MRLSRLLGEWRSQLRFARRACVTERDFLRLTTRTMLFHVANRTGLRLCRNEPFRVTIRFRTFSTHVWLRTFSGDLFVFYELLKDEVYAVPAAVLDATHVRVVVDCGANVGLASLFFADRYPAARIIAVEPASENFSLLKRNVSAVGRIRAIEACVSDGDGVRNLNVAAPAWGIRIQDGVGGDRVESMSLDTLYARFDVKRADLLKVDIEGEEERVFAEPTFLSSTGLVLIELHGSYGLDRFRADVAKAGFEGFPAGALAGIGVVCARRETVAGSPPVRGTDG